jgi:hypothetical protein
MVVSFSVQAGIIASLVISISPDKAGPAVNALTRERSEWSGPGLAAMRAGFQAEIHNKGWQISIPGEARKLFAEHDQMKNAVKR